VLDLELLDPQESFLFIDSEAFFPTNVEVLHMLIANLHVLVHLFVLDVRSKLILIYNDLLFDGSDFLHQILVQLILVDLAALIGIQLHFLLDQWEDEHLLIFIQDAITALVEDIDEFLWGADSQQIIDVVTLGLED